MLRNFCSHENIKYVLYIPEIKYVQCTYNYSFMYSTSSIQTGE